MAPVSSVWLHFSFSASLFPTSHSYLHSLLSLCASLVLLTICFPVTTLPSSFSCPALVMFYVPNPSLTLTLFFFSSTVSVSRSLSHTGLVWRRAGGPMHSGDRLGGRSHLRTSQTCRNSKLCKTVYKLCPNLPSTLSHCHCIPFPFLSQHINYLCPSSVWSSLVITFGMSVWLGMYWTFHILQDLNNKIIKWPLWLCDVSGISESLMRLSPASTAQCLYSWLVSQAPDA